MADPVRGQSRIHNRNHRISSFREEILRGHHNRSHNLRTLQGLRNRNLSRHIRRGHQSRSRNHRTGARWDRVRDLSPSRNHNLRTRSCPIAARR